MEGWPRTQVETPGNPDTDSEFNFVIPKWQIFPSENGKHPLYQPSNISRCSTWCLSFAFPIPSIHERYSRHAQSVGRADLGRHNVHGQRQKPKRAIIQLSKQIDTALKWFEKWHLRVNAQKTVTILFNDYRIPHIRIQVYRLPIDWSTQAMYLGIIFDRGLKFNFHIEYFATKATKTRCMLYPVLNRKSPLSRKAKINIFIQYIRPAISYAGEAWGSQLARSNLSKLETLQTSCIRTITSFPWFVSNHTLLISARLRTMQQLFIKSQTQKTCSTTRPWRPGTSYRSKQENTTTRLVEPPHI